jgi:hypothetical protein
MNHFVTMIIQSSRSDTEFDLVVVDDVGGVRRLSGSLSMDCDFLLFKNEEYILYSVIYRFDIVVKAMRKLAFLH